MKEKLRVAGVVEELDRAGVACSRRARQSRPPPRGSPAPAPRRATVTPTPRSPSGGAAGCVQSRTPTAHIVPWWSAMTWTSTWRAPAIRRSRNTVGVAERVARPSARARSKASPSSAGVVDPPDAAAAAAGGRLDHQRVAERSACAARVVERRTGPPLHGTTGTPACSASRLAPILSPSRRMTSPLRAR